MKLFSLDKFKLIIAQFGILIVVSLLVVFFSGSLTELTSFFCGGIAWLVPSIYFSYRMKEQNVRDSNKSMLRWFFLTEIIKWILNLILIIVILLVFKINAPIFLLGYIMVILSSVIFSSLWLNKNKR